MSQPVEAPGESTIEIAPDLAEEAEFHGLAPASGARRVPRVPDAGLASSVPTERHELSRPGSAAVVQAGSVFELTQKIELPYDEEDAHVTEINFRDELGASPGAEDDLPVSVEVTQRVMLATVLTPAEGGAEAPAGPVALSDESVPATDPRLRALWMAEAPAPGTDPELHAVSIADEPVPETDPEIGGISTAGFQVAQPELPIALEEAPASALPSFDAPTFEPELPIAVEEAPAAELPSFDAPALEPELPISLEEAPAAELPSFDAPALEPELPISLEEAPAAELPSLEAPDLPAAQGLAASAPEPLGLEGSWGTEAGPAELPSQEVPVRSAPTEDVPESWQLAAEPSLTSSPALVEAQPSFDVSEEPPAPAEALPSFDIAEEPSAPVEAALPSFDIAEEPSAPGEAAPPSFDIAEEPSAPAEAALPSFDIAEEPSAPVEAALPSFDVSEEPSAPLEAALPSFDVAEEPAAPLDAALPSFDVTEEPAPEVAPIQLGASSIVQPPEPSPEAASDGDQPVIDLLESESEPESEAPPQQQALEVDVSGDPSDSLELAQTSDFITSSSGPSIIEGGLELGDDPVADFAASLLPNPSGLPLAAGPDVPIERMELATNADFLDASELKSTGSAWTPLVAPAPGQHAAPDPAWGDVPAAATPDPAWGDVPAAAAPDSAWGEVPAAATPDPSWGELPAAAAPDPAWGEVPAPTPLREAAPDPAWGEAPAASGWSDPRSSYGTALAPSFESEPELDVVIEGEELPAQAGPPQLAFAPPAPALDLRGSALSPSYIEGEHKVTVHTMEGQVKRGTIRDVDLMDDFLSVEQQTGATAEQLPLKRLKAVFFMLPPGSHQVATAGTKLRITFNDGRQIAGFSTEYRGDEAGFFIVPADNRTNIARIFVYRAAVRAVAAA